MILDLLFFVRSCSLTLLLERQEIFDGLFLGNLTCDGYATIDIIDIYNIYDATNVTLTRTKRTMFKISIALRLFRYAAPTRSNSNMVKISIETRTNGTPNPRAREWYTGRDVRFITEN